MIRSPPPLPHINVENYIFYIGKVYAVRIINIAIGGGIIMDERVVDFQNIFSHDCTLLLNFYLKLSKSRPNNLSYLSETVSYKNDTTVTT